MATRLIAGGHIALAACFALYLAWWIIFFRPADARPSGALRAAGIACIVAAVALGVAGVAACVTGIAQLPAWTGGIKTWQIALGGLAAYVVLFVMTTVGFDRPPTTELVLIAGWLTLEAAIVNGLFSSGALAAGPALGLLCTVIACAAASLICYVRYYHLAGWAALADGSGPLICGIVLAIVVACLAAHAGA